MMVLTEELLRYAAVAVTGGTAIQYQGIDIDLGQPFRRVTMNDLVQETTGGGGRLCVCVGGGGVK
jgi:lysyl-tRNA synthetase class 2